MRIVFVVLFVLCLQASLLFSAPLKEKKAHTKGLQFQRQRNGNQEQPGALELYPPKASTFATDLDHFGYSDNKTISLRVLYYDEWWDAPENPVFVYCGNEGDIHDFYNATGFMFEIAERMQALVVFIEHRYYGQSLPFGEDSFTNENIRFLTIEQAMADLALYLSSLPQIFSCSPPCYSANDDSITAGCRSVLFGGSYGGMLAAWMRVKYPHLSIGAIASGAPIDFYPKQNKQQVFYNATLSTFQTYGGNDGKCGDHINNALSLISAFGNTAENRSLLTDLFRTCSDMSPDSSSVSRLLFYLKGAVASLAMLDYPYPCNFVTPMPANPVAHACAAFDPSSTDPIGNLMSLKSVVDVYMNSSGQLPCYGIDLEVVGHNYSSMNSGNEKTNVPVRRPLGSKGLGDIYLAWNYQACTELIIEPLTSDGEGFYPEDDIQIAEVIAWCKHQFATNPRTQWIQQATAGSALHFVSNLVLIDNDKDPWHVGHINSHTHDSSNNNNNNNNNNNGGGKRNKGSKSFADSLLHNNNNSNNATTATNSSSGRIMRKRSVGGNDASDSVVTYLAVGGAHHQDLRFSDSADAQGVVEARNVEESNIQQWLLQADECADDD